MKHLTPFTDKPGKDKGVDGRFFTVGNAEGIVQAKHWEHSGLTALLAYLTKSESAKVQLLAPARYILVTSVPLSRMNKKCIKDIFKPYLKSEADIFGNEDIQDFLRDHPKVVEQHYKLWLASAEVLRMIFSAPIVGRSTFKVEEVAAFTPKYVPTRCHEDAVVILNNYLAVRSSRGIGWLERSLLLNGRTDRSASRIECLWSFCIGREFIVC
jgi:hypothetical protein